MKRQTILKSTLCFLMALVCNVAWAQTSTDGPIVTFTNVQKNGTTTFTLYINESGQLATSTSSAAELGDAAKFRAIQKDNGKWAFYNESKQLYMIWRGSDGGYNSNKGVLDVYNSTYCDWTINSGSNSIADTYYLMGKRSDGSTNGTPIITNSGSFDKWTSGIALATNYSNLFKIEGEEYTATLTDTKGVVHECTAKGLPLSGATITNPVWKSGNLTADVAFTIPVSTEEVTNRVIIGSFNDFNNKYFADGTSVKANRNSSAPLPSNVDVKNYLWAFYPTLEGSVFKFKIKNIGTGSYIKSEAVENDHSGDEVSLVAEAEATPFALTALNQLVNTKGYRLSNESTGGSEIKYIGTYNTDHEGTKNKIVDANNYTLTLSDETIYEGTNGVHNLMGGSYTYSNGAWSDNGYSAMVNFAFSSLPFPVSSAVETNATMISSFNEGAGGYGPGRFKWYADDDDVKIERDALVTEGKLSSYSWAIYPTLENGAFVYSIKNVKTGTYIQATKDFGENAGDNNEGTIILSDTPTKFSIDTNKSFSFYAQGRNQYLSLGSSGTTSGFLGLHTKTYADGHKGITNSFHTPLYALDSNEKLESGAVYTFLTARGWVGATTESDNVIATANTTVTPAASTENAMFQWALYQSVNGNYYLYNLGKEMFMGVASQNEGAIPFVENPQSKNMTFKDVQDAKFPIMFSANGSAAVSQNTAKGLFSWDAGWSKNDEGSNHQVTFVSLLPEATLQAIAAKVEAYDKCLYVKAEVEGSWADNPNTHFGSVRATSSAGTLTTNLKTTPSVAVVGYDGLSETTIDFTRAYRGFEFQGFYVDGELVESFTLTDAFKASNTAENPLVAKFTATEAVTLFYDDDEFSYRIPAIGKTSTGRLIAVSDYRHCLDDIGMNRWGKGYRVDLVIRTSDDNGKTWSDKTTIAEGIDNSQANDCAYGDAAIAVVGEEIIVMAVAGSTQYGTGNANKISRLVRVYSSDNGKTWTKTDITEKVYGHEGSLYPTAYTAFFGSGKLAVDPNYNESGNARIYGSLLAQGHGNRVIYSDDKGLTWSSLGGQVAGANEPKVEILPSGQLLFSARRVGGRNFNVFTYTDKTNNEGSWASATNGCDNGGSNGTNGDIILIDAKNLNGENVKLLLQSQPAGGTSEWDRRDVSIWYKEVNGNTYTPSDIATGWSKGLQVSNQLSAYSAMALQEDGKIAFFFEEAPCYADRNDWGYCMVYMPLTIEEITKGNYFSKDATLPESVNVDVVLTDAQGNTYNDAFTSALNGIEPILTTNYPFITLGADRSLSTEDGVNYTYANTVAFPFKVSNEETTVWHNIYLHANGENELLYLYADAADASLVCKKSDGANHPYGDSQWNTAACADNMSWTVYHAGNFTFTFKNKLTGKYIKATSVVTSGNANNVTFVEDGATAFEIVKDVNNSWKGDYALKATIDGAVGYLCNTSSTHANATHFTHTNHQGGWLKFAEAPDFAALIASITEPLESGMYGEGLGQYQPTGDTNLESIRTAMENSSSVKLNTLNNYKSLLDAATLNMPKADQFFRIKNNGGTGYLSSGTGTGRTQFVANIGESASSIFYYDNGKLLAYENGMYLVKSNDNFLHYTETLGAEAGVAFSFAASPARGKYLISFGGRSFYSDGTGNSNAASSGQTGDNYRFTLEEVTELPITIGTLGYGTLYAPVALKIPEHVKAYIGTITEDKTVLELTKITSGVIPKETGVVLYRDGDSYAEGAPTGTTAHNFVITTTTETVANNAFRGSVATIARTSVQGEAYTLQADTQSEIGVAFKPSANNIASGKAYLQLESAQQAQMLRIRFAGEQGGTTEIEPSTLNAQPSTEVYDLQGRRVANPTKGIYIVNGKKVVMK